MTAATGLAVGLGGTAVAQEDPSAAATFDDQPSNATSVTVQSATLSEGGFVAIHDSSLLDGKVLESVIGVSGYLEAGTHENVEVMLYQGVKGADFDQSMLEEDQTLIAMPHLDTDGDDTYEFVASGGEVDGPYTADGGAVTDTAKITVKADEKPTADVTFDDQTTDGTTVTVQSTTMSEGGFVAIHDSSLLDGNVLGSVVGVSEYLEAGAHEDVQVSLFNVPGGDFDMSMLTEDQTLIAMPHLDTNGNETYDFLTSEGKADGPYTADGGAVTDSAKVMVNAETGKPTADLCFPDQKSDGTTVTVKSARLSDGGFVAIHDDRLLEGKALESVVGVSDYLEPGMHRQIEVTLFEGVKGADVDREMLEDGETVFGMPHVDSDGDDTYEFVASGGEVDGPYLRDGKPLVNESTITVSEHC